MRASFFLLVSFWLMVTAAAAQTFSGTITNAATQAGLPYVNIGVVGKALGTVSTEQGAYRLAFQEALANDTVRVSSIGYQTRLLTLRQLRDRPNVTLIPGVGLQEVQVQGKSLFRRNLTLGNTTNSLTSNLNLNTKDLGAEIGTVISIKRRPTRVLTANFNVSYNKVGPLAFRVNFYRLDKRGRPTETKLLPRDIIVRSAVKTGTISVDLTNERLVVDEDFFLALEWIPNTGEAVSGGLPAQARKFTAKIKKSVNKLGGDAPTAPPQTHDLAFSLSVGYVNNDLYLRSTSQARWERVSLGARLMGLQPRISFFVTAQD
jgi:hypothetical protein